MSTDQRLIEDYIPVDAISAEAWREKSVRKGHIARLLLWWARRPLVTAHAVWLTAETGHPVTANRRMEIIEAQNPA